MIHRTPIPAFLDNYIWLLQHGPCAVVVDPGDATPVIAHLEAAGLSLCAILITHHHQDHVGGVAALRAWAGPECRVIGPASSPYDGLTETVQDGDRVRIPELDWEAQVLAVPGHTLDHVAFYAAPHLFCGDTLFGCGCGRLFEGSPDQMYASLQRLNELPDETLVCCAHEYTLSNIRFALAVEPDNTALQQRQQEDAQRRAQQLPTLPSRLDLERATNPFLRCSAPAVRAGVARQTGSMPEAGGETFARLRSWKNTF